MPPLHGKRLRCTGRAAAARDWLPLHGTDPRCTGNAGIEGEKANALEVLEVGAAPLKYYQSLQFDSTP